MQMHPQHKQVRRHLDFLYSSIHDLCCLSVQSFFCLDFNVSFLNESVSSCWPNLYCYTYNLYIYKQTSYHKLFCDDSVKNGDLKLPVGIVCRDFY